MKEFQHFFISNGFVKGKIDTTLFTKHVDSDILIVHIYIDDIIFRSTNENLCKDFESCMKNEFEMFMMGELNYFLKQKNAGIFINQAKYTRKLIKKFGFEGAKISITPLATTTKLDKDEQGINVDIKLYKSMIGSLLYLTANRPDIIFSAVSYTHLTLPTIYSV